MTNTHSLVTFPPAIAIDVPPGVDSGVFPVHTALAPVKLAVSATEDEKVQEIYDFIETTAYNVGPLFNRHKQFYGPLAFTATIIVPHDKILDILQPPDTSSEVLPEQALGYINGLTIKHVYNGTAVILCPASMVVLNTGLRNRLKIIIEGIPVACHRGEFYNMVQNWSVAQFLRPYADIVRRDRAHVANPQKMIHFTDFDQLRGVYLDGTDPTAYRADPINAGSDVQFDIPEIDISIAAKGIMFHVTVHADQDARILRAMTAQRTIEGLTVIYSTPETYRVFPRAVIDVRDDDNGVVLDVTSAMFLVDSKIDVTHYMEVSTTWTSTT